MALGRGGELGVADGRAVAAEEDGVHDGEGAADAEGETEKESDDRAEIDTHSSDDFMREAVVRGYSGRERPERKPTRVGARIMATKMSAVKRLCIMAGLSAAETGT